MDIVKDRSDELIEALDNVIDKNWDMLGSRSTRDTTKTLIITVNIRIITSEKNYTLFIGNQSVVYKHHKLENLTKSVLRAIKMDPGYQIFINNRRMQEQFNDVKKGVEKTLHMLESMCVDIDYIPNGEAMNEFKKDFENLTESIKKDNMSS